MAKFDIDFLADFSEESLIAELQRVARALGQDTLSRKEIDREAKMSSAVVLKRFGSLRSALQAAGLRPTRFTKASDEEILDLVEKAWVASLEKYGRRPQRGDLKSLSVSVSGDTIARRFGSWRQALIAAAERANREAVDQPQEAPKVKTSASKNARKSISLRKRFLIFKRDDYRCRLCKKSGVPIEVDHIVPVAQGGSDALDNLQTLCVPCNRGKRGDLQ